MTVVDTNFHTTFLIHWLSGASFSKNGQNGAKGKIDFSDFTTLFTYFFS